MTYLMTEIDERIAEAMELSEPALYEIVDAVALAGNVSRVDENTRLTIANILSQHLARGILESFRHFAFRSR